jgi:hypothetical protein
LRANADDVAISATIMMAISIRISYHPEIFCGLLTAVVDDVKVDLGAFNEAVIARLLNRRDMNTSEPPLSGKMKP